MEKKQHVKEELNIHVKLVKELLPLMRLEPEEILCELKEISKMEFVQTNLITKLLLKSCVSKPEKVKNQIIVISWDLTTTEVQAITQSCRRFEGEYRDEISGLTVMDPVKLKSSNETHDRATLREYFRGKVFPVEMPGGRVEKTGDYRDDDFSRRIISNFVRKTVRESFLLLDVVFPLMEATSVTTLDVHHFPVKLAFPEAEKFVALHAQTGTLLKYLAHYEKKNPKILRFREKHLIWGMKDTYQGYSSLLTIRQQIASALSTRGGDVREAVACMHSGVLRCGLFPYLMERAPSDEARGQLLALYSRALIDTIRYYEKYVEYTEDHESDDEDEEEDSTEVLSIKRERAEVIQRLITFHTRYSYTPTTETVELLKQFSGSLLEDPWYSVHIAPHLGRRELSSMYLSKANTALSKGDDSSYVLFLTKALLQDQDHQHVRDLLFQHHIRVGDTKQVKDHVMGIISTQGYILSLAKYVEQALKVADGNIELSYSLLRIYLDNGKYNRAKELLNTTFPQRGKRHCLASNLVCKLLIEQQIVIDQMRKGSPYKPPVIETSTEESMELGKMIAQLRQEVQEMKSNLPQFKKKKRKKSLPKRKEVKQVEVKRKRVVLVDTPQQMIIEEVIIPQEEEEVKIITSKEKKEVKKKKEEVKKKEVKKKEESNPPQPKVFEKKDIEEVELLEDDFFEMDEPEDERLTMNTYKDEFIKKESDVSSKPKGKTYSFKHEFLVGNPGRYGENNTEISSKEYMSSQNMRFYVKARIGLSSQVSLYLLLNNKGVRLKGTLSITFANITKEKIINLRGGKRQMGRGFNEQFPYLEEKDWKIKVHFKDYEVERETDNVDELESYGGFYDEEDMPENSYF